MDFIKRAMLATAARYGKAEVRNVELVWDSPRDRAIQTALKDNIRTGRLAKGDFGWSAPSALKPLLDQYARAAEMCPAGMRSALGDHSYS